MLSLDFYYERNRRGAGLNTIAVLADLGAQDEPMLPDYHMILRRVSLLQHPTPDPPQIEHPFPGYMGLRRGLPVRQVGSPEGDFTQVAYEEYDSPMHTLAAPTRSVVGWVESSAITPHLTRHFFHLTPTKPTPDAWVQIAEEWELRFELYWMPLDFASPFVPDLIPSHARWLEQFAPRLTPHV